MTHTTTTAVSYHVHDGLATIELHRGDASNALNAALKTELLQALTAVRADASVRAVALTAEGRNFCVGQDLAEHVEALRADPARAMDTVRRDYNPIVTAMRAIDVPIVAGIRGACVGAGLGLATAADIRIAGAGARFATAFTGIGLAADSGLSESLPRLIGAGRASAMFLLGDAIDASTARDWGLVYEVVDDADVATRTVALAARLATGPTAALRAVKRLLAANAHAAVAEVLDNEADAQERLGASTDHASAVAAFLAKERPVFVGN